MLSNQLTQIDCSHFAVSTSNEQDISEQSTL